MSGIFGVLVNQLIMTFFSKCEPYLVTVGFEAVPLLVTLMKTVRDGVDARNEERELADHLGPAITAYTAVLLTGLVAALLMIVFSSLKVVGLFSFVPEVMLVGIFACIGWQLFAIGFDLSTDGGAVLLLDQPDQLHRLFEPEQWPHWLVGLLLGIALYAAMKFVPARFSSYMIPGYYLVCIVMFNIVFAAKGMSLTEAEELKWTVAAYETDHAWRHLWENFYDSAFKTGQDDLRAFDASYVTPPPSPPLSPPPPPWPPLDCPCLASLPPPYDGTKEMVFGESVVLYPAGYGVGCGTHDDGTLPFCYTPELDDVAHPRGWQQQTARLPTWCRERWCYVNSSDCNSAFEESSYWEQANLTYSYLACGSQDVFQDDFVETYTAMQPRPPPMAPPEHPPAPPPSAPLDCACLDALPPPMDTEGVVFNHNGETYTYPLSYGIGCALHDLERGPFCHEGIAEDGTVDYDVMPSWCTDMWCFVNASACNTASLLSEYVASANLSYSYSACGAENTRSDYHAAKQPRPPPPPSPPVMVEGDGVDWDAIGANMGQIFLCALVGPVFNVAVNLPVLKSRTRAKFDLNDEFMTSGCAQAAAAFGLGYSAYLSVSNTLEHRTNGGTTRASTLVCVVVYLVFLLIHDLHAVFQVIPFPMLGGLFFWMGIHELWSDLGPAVFFQMPLREYAILLLMLASFIGTGMNLIWPFLIGMGVALVLLIEENGRASSIMQEGHPGGKMRSDTFRSTSDTMRLQTIWEELCTGTYVLRYKGLVGFPQARRISDHCEQIAIEFFSDPTKPNPRVILFDFEHVDVMAPSAAMTLAAMFDSLIHQSNGKIKVYISGLQPDRNPRVRKTLLQQVGSGIPTYDTCSSALGAIEDVALGLFFKEAYIAKRTAVDAALPLKQQRRQRIRSFLIKVCSWVRSNTDTHSQAWRVLLFGMLGQWSVQHYVDGQNLASPGKQIGAWLLLSGTVVMLEPERKKAVIRKKPSMPALLVKRASDEFGRMRICVQDCFKSCSGEPPDEPSEGLAETSREKRSTPPLLARCRGFGLILHPSGVILDPAPPLTTHLRAVGEVHALFISASNLDAMRNGMFGTAHTCNGAVVDAANQAAFVLYELSVRASMSQSVAAQYGSVVPASRPVTPSPTASLSEPTAALSRASRLTFTHQDFHASTAGHSRISRLMAATRDPASTASCSETDSRPFSRIHDISYTEKQSSQKL